MADYLQALPATKAGKMIAALTGLRATKCISACRYTLDQHGVPTYGRAKLHVMSADELSEAVPLALAHSGGLTNDLPGFRAAIIENGLAAAIAELIEIARDEGAAPFAGDTLTLDGRGNALIDRIQGESPDSYAFGDPRGPSGLTYTLRGEVLALIARACRVAPVVAVEPADRIVGARVI